jgi:uncharacterized HAD superfamily protein
MRIGLDIDNVTLEFQPYWIELYENWFDLPFDHSYAGTWDGIVDGTHFNNAQEFFSWFDRAGGWDDMPYEVGAPGGIDALLSRGHQIVFVTSRNGDTASNATARWLRESPWGSSLYVQLRTGVQNKLVVPASVYVDDAPHHIEQIAQERPVIVFDKPWNQHVDPDVAVRAKNWHQVVEWVDLIESMGVGG